MNFTTAGSAQRLPFPQNRLLLVFLPVFLVCWALTLIGTPDLNNWFIENTLTALFLLLMVGTHRRFRFSDLSYTLMFVYILLHIYGAMYTYAENPMGYRLKDAFGWSRNPYDRIVHFSFGFMLAYPMRDFFLNKMQFPAWVGWVLPIEITLSFSGLYELIEWLVAEVFFPEQGPAYLGLQGDVWDAQKDMFLAFSGALLITSLTWSLRKMIRKNA
jgi:putative membrane protein